MATKAEARKPKTRKAALPDMNRKPHTVKREYIDNMIARSSLSDSDKTLLQAYCDESKADMAIEREKKITGYLIAFRRCSGMDYAALDIAAVLRTVGRLSELKTKSGKPITQNTRHDIVAIVKKFIRWTIRRKHNTSMTIDDLTEISIPSIVRAEIKPENLVSESERDRLIAACMNLKDKAIISLLYEGGFRPIELCTLTLSDIAFTPVGCTLTVSSKKKKNAEARIRHVPCPMSASYLKAWIDNAPYKIDGADLVFRSLTPTIKDGKREYAPVMEDSMRQQIKAIYKRAGMPYKNPYMMRHTAITRFVNTDMAERKIMEITHGGNTRMLATYYHADKEAIADELTERLHGVSTGKLKEAREAARVAQATQRTCPTCGRIFDTNRKFCDECGTNLTLGQAVNMKAVVQENQTLKAALQGMQQRIDMLYKMNFVSEKVTPGTPAE